MFKDYYNKFPLLSEQESSKELIESEKAAVFARIGTEEDFTEKTADEKPVYIETEEPQVLYPHRVPLWRRVVPIAAAAAVAAAAIPIGANMIRKHQLSVSGASYSEVSEAVSAPDKPEISVQPEKPAQSVPPALSTESVEPALRAFRTYYVYRASGISAMHAAENNTSLVGISGERTKDLSEYFRPLNATNSANGYELTVYGLIPISERFFIIAYDLKTDQPKTGEINIYACPKLDREDLASSEFMCAYAKDSNSQKFGDLYVTVGAFADNYMNADNYSIKNYDKLTFAFDIGKGLFGTEFLDLGVWAEVPLDLDLIPSVETTVKGDDSVKLTINPFCCVLSSLEKDVSDISDVTVVLKDGSECYQAEANCRAPVELFPDIPSESHCLFSAPVELDDIARIELSDGTVIYEADEV